jgi:hypothetical protein
LTRLQGLELNKASGNQRQQVAEAIRPRPEDDNRDAPSAQALFKFESPINGKEHIKFRGFRCGKQGAVFQSCEAGVASSHDFVAGKQISHPFVNTFINQDAHLGACGQELAGFFQSGDSHFA